MNVSAPQASASALSVSSQPTQSPPPPAAGKATEGLKSAFPDNRAWLQGLVAKMASSGSSVPEKDAAKAYNEFMSWIQVGPSEGRVENDKELNDLLTASATSPLAKRLELLGHMEGLVSMKATSNRTNPITARLEFWRGASEVDRDILVNAYTIPDKFGRREFESLDQFYKVLEGYEADFAEILSRPANKGAPLTAKEAKENAAADAEWARRIQILEGSKVEFNRRYGGVNDVTDTIQLSAPAAKEAAKTLAQPVETDDANDAALKALETLKQVSEQQREWAASLAEDVMPKAADATSDGGIALQIASVAKPVSVLSIAA
jgi:hypothetical protein